MPVIPTYTPTQTVPATAGQVPATFRPAITRHGEALQRLGEATTGLGAALLQARKRAEKADEYNRHFVQASRRLQDLDSELRQREEWQTIPEDFETRFKEIQGETLQTVRNNDVRQRLKETMGHLYLTKRISIRAYHRQRQIESYQANLYEAMEQAVDQAEEITGMGTEVEFQALVTNVLSQIHRSAASGIITPLEAEQKEEEITERMAAAYLVNVGRQIIDDLGPEQGLEWLNDPENLPGLDREERNSVISEVGRYVKFEAARLKEVQETVRNELNNRFLRKLHEGSLTIEEILASPLAPVGESGSKEHWIDAIERRSEAILKGEQDRFNTSDPDVYNVKLDLAYRGELDPDSVVQWIGRGLSSKDAEHIRKTAIGSHKEELKHELELRKLAIDAGRKMIVKGTLLTGFDASEVMDAFLFEHSLRDILEKEADPATRVRMLTPGTREYIVDSVLEPYLKSPMERLRNAAERMKPTGIEKRKPGESIADYLKRTGRE